MLSRSSSSSSLSDSSARNLFSCLPADARVLATAGAKVYHTPFSNKSADGWTYSGLGGTLVFGYTHSLQRDRGLGARAEQDLWFRLVDPAKGVVWVHQVPDTLDYAADKPFFHTFSGKSRKFAFRFDDDREAARFLAQVTSHVRVQGPGGRARRGTRGLGQRAAAPQRLAPALVSAPAPGSFVHVAHVGFDARGDIEASDALGPGWAVMLDALRGGSAAPAPAAEAKPQRTEKKKKRSLVPRIPTIKFS